MPKNVVTAKGKASRIEGIPELLAQVERLRISARSDKAKEVFYAGGRILAQEMKRRAAWLHVKAAIFVTKGRIDASNVLVGIRYRIAPDVFWLEFGTYKKDMRRPKKATFLRFQIDGRWIFVRKVANLTPKPFFRPSIAAKRAEVAAVMAAGFQAMIDSAL